jgi:sirohydrochlorin cobaltochelatase
MNKTGIVLFAHGARDPNWARPFHRIRDLLHARLPDTPTELAFLEIMTPTLAEAIDRLATRGAEVVTVIPLFMASGGHLVRDLPEIVRRACEANPGVVVRRTQPIGEIDTLLAAISEWIVAEDAITKQSDSGHPTA